MEDKIAGYRERQNDRKRSKIFIIIFWCVFITVAVLVSNYVVGADTIFFLIGYFGAPVTLIAYNKVHPREKYEMRISADFFQAMSFLKLSRSEKGRAADRHRRRAANYTDRALGIMSRLSERAERSEIMEKEMCGRVDMLGENIKKFVLPRILLGEDMDRVESALSGFSKFFAGQWESLGIEQLDDVNQNLKNLGDPSKEITTFRSTLRDSLRSKPIILILSLLLGFGVSSLIIFGVLTVDAVQWIKSNVGAFIIAGTALSALIAEIFTRS